MLMREESVKVPNPQEYRALIPNVRGRASAPNSEHLERSKENLLRRYSFHSWHVRRPLFSSVRDPLDGRGFFFLNPLCSVASH